MTDFQRLRQEGDEPRKVARLVNAALDKLRKISDASWTYFESATALAWRSSLGTGLTYIGSITTASGGTTLTDIPQSSGLLLVWAGVSHNDGSNQAFRLELSDDNGSTWGTANVVTNAIGAANSIGGQCWVLRTGEDGETKIISPNLGGVGAVAAWHDTSTEATKTGVTSAIRVTPAAGTSDAGAVYVFAIN